MNRSIFQITRIKWFYNVLLGSIIIILLNYDNYVNCFSNRGVSDLFLKELQCKNLVFRCSKEIKENIAFEAITNLLQNNYNKNNFSIVKYYKIENNTLITFPQYSCYAHPNLFLGTYNNLYFNLQFFHKQHKSSFNFLSSNDIIGSFKNQYICNQIYLYSNNLNQQFLNFNDLNKNSLTPYKQNLHNIQIQDYINKNNSKFNNIINKTLKI